jgi:small ligand-binding sensory domain FIST
MTYAIQYLIIFFSWLAPVASFWSTNTPSRRPTFLRQSWQSHVSTHPESSAALTKLIDEITGNKDEIDLVFLFVGQTHASDFEAIVKQAADSLGSNTRLLSLIGGGVIGERQELDEPQRPSMSILTGTLPEGAEMKIFSYNDRETVSLDYDCASYLLFADPWSSVDSLMKELSQTNSVVAGGISCPPGAQPSLAIDGLVLPQGSVAGVSFSGTLGLQAVVAQGCRPLGPSFQVTACEQNVITELNNKPALQLLQDLASSATGEEQEQIRSGLVCGIAAATEDEEEDYLIRQITGLVPTVNGIAIGGQVNVGDRFCFHIRDKSTAEQDLQLMVQRAKTHRLFDETKAKPVAAVQISCVARGRGLFDVPNVDLSNIQNLLDGPVAGFFANGEIGPVGIAGFSTTNSKTYLHTFTTVAALLCDYSGSKDKYSASAPLEDPVDAWG